LNTYICMIEKVLVELCLPVWNLHLIVETPPPQKKSINGKDCIKLKMDNSQWQKILSFLWTQALTFLKKHSKLLNISISIYWEKKIPYFRCECCSLFKFCYKSIHEEENKCNVNIWFGFQNTIMKTPLLYVNKTIELCSCFALK